MSFPFAHISEPHKSCSSRLGTSTFQPGRSRALGCRQVGESCHTLCGYPILLRLGWKIANLVQIDVDSGDWAISQFRDAQLLRRMLHFVIVQNAKKRMLLSNCKHTVAFIVRSGTHVYGRREPREDQLLAVKFQLARMEGDCTIVRSGLGC
ncbi:hypothetical protein PMIN06_009431 [Paraphaeosphaeria minitans]